MMERLIIEPTVGYMLKVMKTGMTISQYKNEFAAIRHGNYDEFISLIGESKGDMVAYQNGEISTQDNIDQKSHGDFAGLLLAGPSLKKFFEKCVVIYGRDLVRDEDEISNIVYGQIVKFELSLRMHANNYLLINDQEDLINVIKKICKFKNIPIRDMDELQNGRLFINDIKHHTKPKYKRKFKNWSDGVLAFVDAYKILEKYKLTIL